jgi:hypothetical protein
MARPRAERRVRDMTKPQKAYPAFHPFAEPDKWETFLIGLTKGMSVTKACVYGSIHASDAYKRRREDPQFAECWALAVEAGTDVLEDEAFKRAVDGKSDYLLSMLLKARRPAYRDKWQAGDVKVNVNIGVTEMSDEELMRIARMKVIDG